MFCLGLKDKADALDADLDVLADPFKSMAKMTVKMCACAGSGDVMTIQKLLHICSEHYTPAPVIIIFVTIIVIMKFLKCKYLPGYSFIERRNI